MTYGLAAAAQMSFLSYVYLLVDKSYYQKMTSAVQASILVGHFVAEMLGRRLYSYGNTSLQTLVYVSFGALCIAFVFSLVGLPSERRGREQQRCRDDVQKKNIPYTSVESLEKCDATVITALPLTNQLDHDHDHDPDYSNNISDERVTVCRHHRRCHRVPLSSKNRPTA